MPNQVVVAFETSRKLLPMIPAMTLLFEIMLFCPIGRDAIVQVLQAGAAHIFSSNRRYFLPVGAFSITRFVALSLKIKKLRDIQVRKAAICDSNHTGQHPRGAALPLQTATDLNRI